jgi:DNA-binding NtrC family response regulator
MQARMEDLIADRFVSSRAGQLDLASGAPVRIRFVAAESPAHQAAWSDRCATLARLRHPLLNALVDYGAADRLRLFEAYESGAPVPATRTAAAQLIGHVVRFLESYALPLQPDRAARIVRQVTHGPSARGRPLGIVLQPRQALDAIGEVLRDAAPLGAVSIAVCGDPGSGMRTLWMLAARAARLAGYVPVAARLLALRPEIAGVLVSRHVAILMDGRTDPAARLAVAALVSKLGAASTRHHVIINFGGGAPAGSRGLHLDRMGGTSMYAMVYRDREDGPGVEELREAVRAADGRPGALVAHLRGAPIAAVDGRVSVVHESAAEYVVIPDLAPQRPAPRRISAALRGAAERAGRLAAGGRHAAAVRLLARATRVLEGRQEPVYAARCALALAWIQRSRGRSAQSLEALERARSLAGDTGLAVRASIATGVIWTDENRLMEAEAVLRSAQTAAALLTDSEAEREAAVALARCVLWQGRADQAAAILQPALTDNGTVSAWALACRVHLARNATDSAGRAASRAWELAAAREAPVDVAVAARVTALVRAATGDVHGARQAARQALAAAAAAHLPLLALRARAAWLVAHRATLSTPEAVRIRARLAAAARGPLPPLLRRQLEAACAQADEAAAQGGSIRECAVADLRQVLETTQSAPDDLTALQALADWLLARVRAAAVVIMTSQDSRVVVRAGRAWGNEPVSALQAMAGNAAVQSRSGPPECAAPITFGGETIGAAACRWSAGNEVDIEQAAALCGAAALAAASSLRGLADRAPAPPPDATGDDLLGTSPSATELRRAIQNAARAPFPTLILGESGSGKELVARAIHRLGPRRHRRLCTINCAAISDELLEAELFGHTRGAFTGAVTERPGLFEEADGGTLFLDEVGELSARAQAKLLRVLQDGEVRRVGENMPRRVDTRVIAATNRCLEQEVQAGRFRADLRFRLDVIRITVPPLRDRATDIPALVAHFWEDASARVGSRATLAPETVAALTRYEWPGNVRELQNAVASIAVHGPRRGRITPGTLPSQLARTAATTPASFEAAREEFERRYVRAALAQAGGRRTGAARALGVSRQGLAKMLRRLGIDDGADPGVA